MPNFFVSYDLNSGIPTHAQVDKEIQSIGTDRWRVLESVWWIKYKGSLENLHAELKSTFGPKDRYLIINPYNCSHHRLIGGDDQFTDAWNRLG